MIEWKSERPRSGDKRIKRRFCWYPRRSQQDMVVWLDYIYLFQQYRDNGYAEMDSWTRGFWETQATLSPSQYKKFVDNMVLNVTDPREKIREFAELVAKKGKK